MKKLKPMSKSRNKNRIGVPSKLAARSTTKVKQSTQSKTTKEQRHVQKKSPSHSGEIYFVHPSHLIAKGKVKNYIAKKGNSNPRPVAVVKVSSDKSTSIAQIYGSQGNPKNAVKKHRVKLQHTKLKKSSWIDTDEKNKSLKTNKKYKVGEPPLNKKSGRVHPNDMMQRNKVSKLLKQKKPSR